MKFDDGKTYTAIFFKSIHDLEKQFNASRQIFTYGELSPHAVLV